MSEKACISKYRVDITLNLNVPEILKHPLVQKHYKTYLSGWDKLRGEEKRKLLSENFSNFHLYRLYGDMEYENLQIKKNIEVDGGYNRNFVDYDDSVEGPITAIDLFNNNFVILGQTVQVDDMTVYDGLPAGPQDLTGLAVGDNVEVSGLFTIDGTLLATRIEYDHLNGEDDITGYVSNPGANQFFINDLEIDISAAVFENFNGQGPVTDDFVEVKERTISINL